MSTSPELLVRGSLRQTPLAEFLIQAYDDALDGTLLLQTREREKSAILFLRGTPAKARPAQKTVFLGEVAVDLGLISRGVAQKTRERAEAEGRTHGSVLREEGHLDETGLFVALREQLFRQVLNLADLPDTTGFGFYRANYLADWGDSGQWRVKPLPMIWRALVGHLPETRREAWLQRLGETSLQMRPEAPVVRYHLTTPETSVVDMLRAKAMPLSQLMRSGVGAPDLVRRVACALLLSRQVEVGSPREPVGLHEPPETSNSLPPPERPRDIHGVTAPRGIALRTGVPLATATTLPPGTTVPPGMTVPPGSTLPSGMAFPPKSPPRHTAGGASASPARASEMEGDGSSLPPESERGASSHPPRSVRSINPTREGRASQQPGSIRPTPEMLETIRAEIEEYRARAPHDYYEVLGLERNADAATVRGAFFQLARRWHPDRLPEELSDLRPYVTQAFSRMGEAHQTLIDDKKRAEYNQSYVPPAEEVDEEQEQVAAILRGAQALQRAEILLKKKDVKGALVEAQTAYEADPTQADHIAMYAWVQGMQRTENFAELIKMLDSALKSDPNNIRAHWYRGQLFKKAGNNLKAIKDFKTIIQLKPNHVDAQRELRVYSMRKRTDPEGRGGGLFSRFKKKD